MKLWKMSLLIYCIIFSKYSFGECKKYEIKPKGSSKYSMEIEVVATFPNKPETGLYNVKLCEHNACRSLGLYNTGSLVDKIKSSTSSMYIWSGVSAYLGIVATIGTAGTAYLLKNGSILTGPALIATIFWGGIAGLSGKHAYDKSKEAMLAEAVSGKSCRDLIVDASGEQLKEIALSTFDKLQEQELYDSRVVGRSSGFESIVNQIARDTQFNHSRQRDQ